MVSCFGDSAVEAKLILCEKLSSAFNLSPLSGDMLLSNIFNNNLSSIHQDLHNKLSAEKNDSELTENNIFYSETFNQYLVNFLETNSIFNDTTVKDLTLYTNGLNNLGKINQFLPVMNECLIDPLKIIFNFGSLEEVTNKSGLNEFDLDIKVRILDETEKYNSVGWKCGHLNTSYLNWVTADNTQGGPEVVIVDVDKYKFYNRNNTVLKIEVNACWFEMTRIESKNASIYLNWKGYFYFRSGS